MVNTKNTLKRIIWIGVIVFTSIMLHAQLPELVPQFAHNNTITATCQNNSFSSFFTADERGVLKRWDIKTNKLISTLPNAIQEIGLTHIDYIADVSRIGNHRLLVHSYQKQHTAIIDYMADTVITHFYSSDELLHVRSKYIDKTRTKNKYGLTFVLFSTWSRVYLDGDDFTPIDTIRHPFEGFRNFDVDEYATMMFAEVPGGIQSYRLEENGSDYKRKLTSLKTSQEITKIKYSNVNKGEFANLLLAASDSFYFIINPSKGTSVPISRYVSTNSDIRLIDKILPLNQKVYHYKYDNLGFLADNTRLILGELMVNLRPFSFERIDMPELNFMSVGYKNYGEKNVLLGINNNNVTAVYVGKNDKFEQVQMGGYAEKPTKLFFNSTYNFLYAFTDHLKMWDLNKAQLSSESFNWSNQLHHFALNENLQFAVFDYDTKTHLVSVYDFIKGEYVASVPKKANADLIDLQIDESGFYTIITWKEKNANKYIIQLWNIAQDKLHKELEVSDLQSLSRGNYGLEMVVATPAEVAVYSYPDLKKLNKLKYNDVQQAFHFGKYSNHIIIRQHGNVYTWNGKDKKLGNSFQTTSKGGILDILPVSGEFFALVSDDGELFRAANSNQYVLEVFNGDKHYLNIPCGQHKPISVVPNKDGTQLIIAFNTGKIEFVDVQTAKPVVTLISQNKDIASYASAPITSDYVFYTPDNYYTGTRNIYDLVSIKHDHEIYSTSHYDLHYNNPLKVLDALGSKGDYYKTMETVLTKRSSAQIKSESELYDSKNLPEIFDLNDSLPSRTSKDSVSFFIHVNGKGKSIKTLYIYANGVPVLVADQSLLKSYFKLYPTLSDAKATDKSSMFDMAMMLRSLSSQESVSNEMTLDRFRFVAPIKLDNGKNTIEFFCVDEEGNRSKVQTYVIEKITRARTKLHVIALSTSLYENADFNLKYAVKDGRDILSTFNQRKIVSSESFLGTILSKEYNYDEIEIDSLFNENATRENFLNLRQKLESLNPQDAVILFVSGHGLLDDNLEFWYAGHDMDFNNPAKNGISYAMIEDVLSSTPARRRILLLDACHSGEVDKSQDEGIKNASNPDIVANFRGASVADDESQIGLQESYNLMKELFDDVTRKSGIQVISAASGDSYALESSDWQNGVFTYCILKALEGTPFPEADLNYDKIVSVSELLQYTSTNVEILTNGAQKPTSRQINLEFDFGIW